MRWDQQKADAERGRRLPGIAGSTGVIRTFDAPEAIGVRFHEIEAKSALNHVPGNYLPFNYTVNPFRGCSHGCHGCFARATHDYLDLDPAKDWDREVIVKVNVPELLRAELARPSWKRELVAFGTNTDPYQWVESHYGLMPPMLEALAAARTPVSVLTRSPLALRDFDLFLDLNEIADVSVNFSVPTLDEKIWRETEPHTPNPRKRLEAVAKLNDAGIASGVMIAPLMPGINDDPEQVKEIADLAEQAGATFIGGIALHLRKGVKEEFIGWLSQSRPELVERYAEMYEGRAYLAAADKRRIERGLEGRARRRRRPARKAEHAKQVRAEPRQPTLF